MQQQQAAVQRTDQQTTPLYGGMEYLDPFTGGTLEDLLPEPMRTARTTNAPDETKMAQGGAVDTFWYPQAWEDILDILNKG